MKTKIEKLYDRLNEAYRTEFLAAFKNKFGLEADIEWNLFTMSLYSRRKDGKKVTKEQKIWGEAFSEGYAKAMNNVREDIPGRPHD